MVGGMIMHAVGRVRQICFGSLTSEHSFSDWEFLKLVAGPRRRRRRMGK